MINDIKSLKKLIQMCRANGVTKIKLEGVELEMLDTPVNAVIKRSKKQQSDDFKDMIPGIITENTKIDTDGLTEEAMLYWSATGDAQ